MYFELVKKILKVCTSSRRLLFASDKNLLVNILMETSHTRLFCLRRTVVEKQINIEINIKHKQVNESIERKVEHVL